MKYFYLLFLLFIPSLADSLECQAPNNDDYDLVFKGEVILVEKLENGSYIMELKNLETMKGKVKDNQNIFYKPFLSYGPYFRVGEVRWIGAHCNENDSKCFTGVCDMVDVPVSLK